jgi:hypothetical protein
MTGYSAHQQRQTSHLTQTYSRIHPILAKVYLLLLGKLFDLPMEKFVILPVD